MKKKEFKILVAEDDAIVRDVIIKFLSEEGYTVVVAEDGLDAIEQLRLEDVKLVLADLRMPGADGMEVLRTAMQINPKMAVVLLTAYGTLDTALEAMKEGAYDYIVKPFVMQQLLLVVRNAYRMTGLMDENERLSRHLKDMHRNLDGAKLQNKEISEAIASAPAERIEKLRELGAITESEAEVLKERLESGGEQDDVKEKMKVKEYNSLIKGLRTDSDK